MVIKTDVDSFKVTPRAVNVNWRRGVTAVQRHSQSQLESLNASDQDVLASATDFAHSPIVKVICGLQDGPDPFTAVVKSQLKIVIKIVSHKGYGDQDW